MFSVNGHDKNGGWGKGRGLRACLFYEKQNTMQAKGIQAR